MYFESSNIFVLQQCSLVYIKFKFATLFYLRLCFFKINSDIIENEFLNVRYRNF